MKVCIDAGHGMGNKTAGKFDTGAVGGQSREADVALAYAFSLKSALSALGVAVFLTRSDNATPCPVGRRAAAAAAAGCTALVSLHLNAYNGRATGAEALYREARKDGPLAQVLLKELVRVTGLKERGIIERRDLAVLKFAAGPAVLLELGFIDNARDRSLLLQDAVRSSVTATLAKAIRDALKPAAKPRPARRFENIYATEFGGGDERGMPSAYGGKVNPDACEASLPARVLAARRLIIVENPKNLRQISFLINDVGPWNTADAYFDGSGRPAAEQQFAEKTRAQNKRVPTNPAGIDLTPAGMDALGIPGKPGTRSALVNWWFDDAPEA